MRQVQCISVGRIPKHLKFEEFTRAVGLGLFDYMRKSRSRGFVVSLSGGADSSALSCLVALLVHFGIHELGAERFAKRLIPEVRLAASATVRDWVRALLTTVYQCDPK